MRTLENKSYVCILMADYDSATPLYDFLPRFWDSAGRGKLPLMWGINPNLIETYPDLISYYYSTASEADTFASDASAAGYMNPNRIHKAYLPLFIEHNRRFFHETDLTLAPMVLDRDEPSPAVKDAFTQFAPDGFATIVDPMGGVGKPPVPHVWKGMPVTLLINNVCDFPGPDQTATVILDVAKSRKANAPGFYLFRIVWTDPKEIIHTMAAIRRKRPDANIELLDPYTFFALFKESQQRKN
jgi:hypothetical protein